MKAFDSGSSWCHDVGGPPGQTSQHGANSGGVDKPPEEIEQMRFALLNIVKNMHFSDMLLMQNVLKNLNVSLDVQGLTSEMEDDTW